jgi:stage II sporulation protein D
MSREHPATTQAVKATAGRILIHNRRVPLTLYHANSGGCTESLSGVWAGRRSYLTAVADDFSKGRPGSRWRSTLTGASICDHLAGFDIHARELAGLSPLARSDTRRIQKIELSIDGKPLLLSGNSFRLMLGPGTVKSTLFSIQKTKDGYVFEGSGYGHGVGMSQWGAYSMARAGHSPAAILEHYYPGTRIVQIQ